MAAHTDVTTTLYAAKSLTVTGSATGFDGPSGATRMYLYVSTAAAVVYAQVGDQTDGSTDISGTGGLVPTETWVEIECHPSEAPGPSASRPTVFLQTDTNPTAIRYRFVRGS